MRGSESDVAREARLSQHVKGAKVVVVGGGLAGYSAAIEAARCVRSRMSRRQVWRIN